MKKLLKMISGFGRRPDSVSVKPAINLAAFGKHPGWDDHIPGIGLETEALAHLKQSFYVTGIGSQIDAGAWEKLEVEKRVEDFGHAFLWLRNGHALLGRLWSSVDRKGRSKYPMIVCADGQGIPTGLLLKNAWRELEQLRDSCRTFTTAEQVEAECRSSQGRLRSQLESSTETDRAIAIPIEKRQLFLDSPQFGERKEGLLRILHELAGLQSSQAKVRNLSGDELGNGRSRHLRVPAIAQKHDEIFALWAAFFRAAVADNLPLLLIMRDGVNWLDVIVGEPMGDEFFCLQSSPLATPLATQIPYELKPELAGQLQVLTTKFLNPPVTTLVGDKKHAELAVKPDADNTSTRSGSVQGGGKSTWMILVLAVTLTVGAGWFFFHSRRPESPTVTSAEARVKPLAMTNQSDSQLKYAATMAAAAAALKGSNYDVVITQADAALVIKSGDEAAMGLKDQAKKSLAAVQLAQQTQQAYQAAMATGTTALTAKNFNLAIVQADTALGIKPGDTAATGLKAQANEEQAAALVAQQTQQAYQAAINRGEAAFSQKDYANAIAQSREALKIKSNDAAALGLIQRAQVKLDAQTAARRRQEQLNALLAASQTAFDQKDFATARSKASEVLDMMPDNASAQTLKAAAQKQVDFLAALSAGQSALKRNDYAEARRQAQSALAISPASSQALKLQEEAAAGIDLQKVKLLMSKPDYTAALTLCSSHPGDQDFLALANEIRRTELQTIDDHLETYQVWFGLIKPSNAKSDMARKPEQKKQAEDLANGQFTDPVIKYYTSLITNQESQLIGLQQLDAGRALIIKKLKKAVDEHR